METETEAGCLDIPYSHYFQFKARKDKNIQVKCTLCPGARCLSTSAKSMSNLSKHWSAQHGNTKLVAKDHALWSSEGVDQQPTPPKQAKLFSSVGAQVTQKDLNRLLRRNLQGSSLKTCFPCQLLNRPDLESTWRPPDLLEATKVVNYVQEGPARIGI